MEDNDNQDEQAMWLVVDSEESESVECFEVYVNCNGGNKNDCNDDDYDSNIKWTNSLPVTCYPRHTSGTSRNPYKPCNTASFDAIYA